MALMHFQAKTVTLIFGVFCLGFWRVIGSLCENFKIGEEEIYGDGDEEEKALFMKDIGHIDIRIVKKSKKERGWAGSQADIEHQWLKNFN